MNVVNIVLFIIRDEEVVPAIVCIYNSLTHRIHSLLIDIKCVFVVEQIVCLCVLFFTRIEKKTSFFFFEKESRAAHGGKSFTMNNNNNNNKGSFIYNTACLR